MKRDQMLRASERWFRLLLRLYPGDFRDEMGTAMTDAYRDRARHALDSGSSGRLIGRLAGVWGEALSDSLRNGLGERFRPSVAWRRVGNWGRDM